MTTRRQFLLAGSLGVVAPVASYGQARNVPRIGVLHAGSSKEPLYVQREPFERGLRELGWVPGSTVLIEYRYAEGDATKLPELAGELVRSKVDVIVARASAAINAARKATSAIPIVMSAYPGDPAADGVVKGTSRPGGNITGIAGFLVLDEKRLELLKEVIPKISRVGVLSNPKQDGDRSRHDERMAILHTRARALKVQLQMFEITQAAQLHAVFSAINKAKVDALLVRGDPEILDPKRAEIATLVNQQRLPSIYWWPFFVEVGGLMSYGDSIPAFHYRSATYVSRILKGANAGDLPIERPTKFELALNMKTAKALGLEIPKAVMFRADRVFE